MIFHRIADIFLLMTLVLALASCSGKHDSPIMTEDEPAMVNLSFSVVVPSDAMPYSSSRSDVVVTTPDQNNYFEPEASNYERIHTLRVIILRPDGNGNQIVEHNKLFTLSDEGVVQYDDLTFKVVGGESKSIYLIANEFVTDRTLAESNGLAVNATYTGLIESLTLSTGSVFGTGGTLINNTDDSDTRAYIPMSEVYHNVQVRYPETEADRNQTVGTFFITRAAVKFSFTASADHGDDLYVTDITFHSLADTEYLLPNNTVYSPPKGESGITNGTDTPYSDLTGHFITSYDIPAAATHQAYTFDCQKNLPLGTKEVSYAPYLYFCESKSTAAYTVDVTIAAIDENGEKSGEYTFKDQTLPNLPILPRNTHVKINMHFTKVSVDFEVDLVPYIGITLEPVFGKQN